MASGLFPSTGLPWVVDLKPAPVSPSADNAGARGLAGRPAAADELRRGARPSRVADSSCASSTYPRTGSGRWGRSCSTRTTRSSTQVSTSTVPRRQPVWENAHYFKGLHREFPDGKRGPPVPAVSAACMLIAREHYEEAGGLPLRYVQGDYEDSDICLRLSKAGSRTGTSRMRSSTTWRPCPIVAAAASRRCYNMWLHSECGATGSNNSRTAPEPADTDHRGAARGAGRRTCGVFARRPRARRSRHVRARPAGLGGRGATRRSPRCWCCATASCSVRCRSRSSVRTWPPPIRAFRGRSGAGSSGRSAPSRSSHGSSCRSRRASRTGPSCPWRWCAGTRAPLQQLLRAAPSAAAADDSGPYRLDGRGAHAGRPSGGRRVPPVRLRAARRDRTGWGLQTLSDPASYRRQLAPTGTIDGVWWLGEQTPLPAADPRRGARPVARRHRDRRARGCRAAAHRAPVRRGRGGAGAAGRRATSWRSTVPTRCPS